MSDETTRPDQVARSEETAAESEETAAEEVPGTVPPADPGRRTTSLVSPLMSGRSLEPLDSLRRPSWLRAHLRPVVIALVVIALAAGVGVAKIVAENAARSSTAERVQELRVILEGATPRDFLAFDAGVRIPDSVARRIREQDGFVNLRAGADSTAIRIQPEGWWAGFTERCIVIWVHENQTLIDVVKRSCVRVDVSGS